MKQKNENATRPGGAGRKPKADPAVFRYSISFNAIDHARFLALFDPVSYTHLTLPTNSLV